MVILNNTKYLTLQKYIRSYIKLIFRVFDVTNLIYIQSRSDFICIIVAEGVVGGLAKTHSLSDCESTYYLSKSFEIVFTHYIILTTYVSFLLIYRFYGRLSNTPDNHEEETLSAIRKNMSGLRQISGERIWMELKKILAGNYSKDLILLMLDLGVSPYIGLPSEPDTEEFKRVCERLENLKISVYPITRLTALLRTDKEVEKFNLCINFLFS